MERELQKLSWLKIQKLVPLKIDTIIFPVGTVEAHGSSCIGTDNYIPTDIALGIAERLNALVAPTVNYGITRSLYRYPGGSTIRPETFELYIREILDSFVDSKFHNIILLNGHGGNNSSLKQAAIDFHQQKGANIAVIHWWELCAEMTNSFFGHAGGHAGTDETAYVHAISTDFVDEKSNNKDLAYTFRPGADIYPVPGSVLLYKEGEGYPEYNQAKAKKYRQNVINAVGEFAEFVLKRWRKFGL